jgi:hypothetical protein
MYSSLLVVLNVVAGVLPVVDVAAPVAAVVPWAVVVPWRGHGSCAGATPTIVDREAGLFVQSLVLESLKVSLSVFVGILLGCATLGAEPEFKLIVDATKSNDAPAFMLTAPADENFSAPLLPIPTSDPNNTVCFWPDIKHDWLSAVIVFLDAMLMPPFALMLIF